MTLYKLQKYSFITEQYVIAGRKVLLTDEYRILKRGKSAGFVSFNSTGLTSVIEKAGKKSTLKKIRVSAVFFSLIPTVKVIENIDENCVRSLIYP